MKKSRTWITIIHQAQSNNLNQGAVCQVVAKHIDYLIQIIRI